MNCVFQSTSYPAGKDQKLISAKQATEPCVTTSPPMATFTPNETEQTPAIPPMATFTPTTTTIVDDRSPHVVELENKAAKEAEIVETLAWYIRMSWRCLEEPIELATLRTLEQYLRSMPPTRQLNPQSQPFIPQFGNSTQKIK